MKEKITVDAEALQKEVIESAEKNGLVVKAYCPKINMDMLVNAKAGTSPVAPLVNVEGCTNPIMMAFMIRALQSTISGLKAEPDVEAALAFVNMITTQRNIEIKNERKSL